MIIIGITGTIGAGKGTVVKYLCEEKGYKHYSARGFIVEEIKRREMEVNRDSMMTVGNALRTEHDSAYVITSLCDQAILSGGDAVIESIRTPGEVAAMRGKANFYLLAVDADIKVRYSRITNRGLETDQVSFDEFVAQESREMQSDDLNKQNLSACIKQADFMIQNDGSQEDLWRKIEGILLSISLAKL
ncbi:MAG: AAA family ATPase [Candidatus Vogelbacteria bacterium]|nr:AAA family ATPase [Candidatus Vogelbacteria bacterium]